LSVSRRRGTNLIELAVVISLETVLLATAVGLIGRLLEAEQAGRADLEAMMSLDGLEDQFRRDVNAAGSMSLPQNGTPLALKLQLGPDHLAAYEVHEGRVLRSEMREEKIVHREAYRLPRLWSVSFSELAEGPIRIVRLEISRPQPDASPASAPRLACEAVLGRDARLTAIERSGR
jgi:hypothetical protein